MGRKISAFLLILAISVSICISQTIYLPSSHEIYQFLKRMEAKQLLLDYKDAAKPLSRMTLAQMLIKLEPKVNEMSRVERETYEFLVTEFKYEMLKIAGDNEPSEVRWHVLSTELKEGMMNLDLNYRLTRVLEKNQQTNYRTQGLKLYGYVYNDVGFYFNWVDNKETGDNLNPLRLHTPEQGIVPRDGNSQYLEYNAGDAQFTWKTGAFSFSLEKNVNVWGYGRNGSVIFSNRAPSYPQIKMRVPISDNIDFIYFHGELNSNQIDSSRSYYTHYQNSTLTFFRQVDQLKYIAAHMLDISLFKGVDLSLGESVVYSDRGPLLVYLIPVMFFKAGEWYNRDKDNTQIFGSIDLNVIKNVNYYFSILIDELNADKIFNADKSHRQLAFTTGFQLFNIPANNLDFIAEYTRANPYVYNHKFPATTFTNNGYDLGTWIGQNADDLYFELGFTPMHSLRIAVFSEAYRKGAMGKIEDQYSDDQGRKPFLFDLQHEEHTIGISGRYQPWRDVFVDMYVKMRKVEDKTDPSQNQNNHIEFNLAAGVGLW
jgi:hypothetical protein